MPKRRRNWLALFAIFSLLLVVLPTPASSQEIRGVWLTNVDSTVLFSRDALERTVTDLAELNFNTLYPAVWSWGYTLYPSAVGEREMGYRQGLYPDLEDTGRNELLESAQENRDMLQELVALAHDRQLAVIPWFEFGFMAPASSPLAQSHPDWLTQRQGGLPEARHYQEGRHRRVWLNPFHPQVQQFLLDLIDELMANYPVDGLQLDDHFGLPVEFGYDPYTVALYRQEHRGQAPPASPHDPEWMRWRADKISQFVERVFWVVKAQRPQAVLSVSPNPAEFAYARYLQDWPRWRQRGYIEELIVQVYRNNAASFRATLQQPALQQARRHIPTGIGILAGLKDRPVSTAQLRRQAEIVRQQRFPGMSFFYYDTLRGADAVAGERRAALADLFAAAAERATVAAP